MYSRDYDWQINIEATRRKVKVEPPNFYGTHDPHDFCDWIGIMHYFSDLYEFFDERRVQFARCKLKDPAKVYWTTVERQLERAYQRPIDTCGDVEKA